MSRVITSALIVCAVGLGGVVLAQTAAPPAGIKRTLLQTVDVPATNYNAISAVAEIVPSTSIGRHTHPGPETGYVIDGDATLFIDGQPPKMLKAGDSYQIPAGVVHDARSGEKGAKVIAVYVVEKGKPLASPAP